MGREKRMEGMEEVESDAIMTARDGVWERKGGKDEWQMWRKETRTE